MDEYGAETVQNLHFFYEAQSRPAFVEYNDTKYRYIHNLQGDIVGIVDGNGNLVVEYKYDAWGKPISITGTLKTSLGELNPFRYRGYVYDEETELFYLRDRYYDSCFERFISPDCCIGYNLYSYADNTPISKYDPSGKTAIDVPLVYEVGKAIFEFLYALIKAAVIAVGTGIAISRVSLVKPRSEMTDSEVVDDIVATKTLLLQNGIDTAVKKAIDPKNKYTEGKHWHHIVPKAHSAAMVAREVLENAGIDVWTAPQNQVELSAQFHKYLHSEYYILGINIIMKAIESYTVAKYSNDNDKTKEMLYSNVTLGLKIIGGMLTVADKTVMKHYNKK